MRHGPILPIPSQTGPQPTNRIIQMSIPNRRHRQGRVPCTSRGPVRRLVRLVSLGEESLGHGFVLKLGLLEHGRE